MLCFFSASFVVKIYVYAAVYYAVIGSLFGLVWLWLVLLSKWVALMLLFPIYTRHSQLYFNPSFVRKYSCFALYGIRMAGEHTLNYHIMLDNLQQRFTIFYLEFCVFFPSVWLFLFANLQCSHRQNEQNHLI